MTLIAAPWSCHTRFHHCKQPSLLGSSTLSLKRLLWSLAALKILCWVSCKFSRVMRWTYSPMQTVCLHYWFFHITLYWDFSQAIPLLSHTGLTCNKGIWGEINHFPLPITFRGLGISIKIQSCFITVLECVLSQPIIMSNLIHTVQGLSKTVSHW